MSKARTRVCLGFFGAPSLVPRPFYARACVFPLNRMREREKEGSGEPRTGQGWNVRKGVRMQLATEISDAL